jgi:uncharacterized protein YgiM (DUF1202 family)
MKTILIVASFLVLLFTSTSQAQISSSVSPSPTPTPETATVSSVKANIREEGNKTSKVIETVNKGTKLIILDEDENGTWFQVETENNIGWVNGSLIKLDDSEKERIRREPKPRPTNKAATGGRSPFQETYTGADDAEVDITNDSYKDMNLRFGGVSYKIKSGTSRTINIRGGNYQFTASAPGVRSLSGIKSFNDGYRYSWRFFITMVRSY